MVKKKNKKKEKEEEIENGKEKKKKKKKKKVEEEEEQEQEQVSRYSSGTFRERKEMNHNAHSSRFPTSYLPPLGLVQTTRVENAKSKLNR
ncbi:unnamed protein product [Nippostrongylus brasiliensis]|uniref:Uncharacterized protein n=1 Tax=Nippostrongylus brasiliensis TaxID=27835 RepID=A0A0N4XXM5_NIPBR|nr:unnamed protein product [Nippostrongylus brasiliensis]